jgi:hypothetical protein
MGIIGGSLNKLSSGAPRLPHSPGQRTRLGLLFFVGKGWPPKISGEDLSPFYGFAKVSTMMPFKVSDTQRTFPLASKPYGDCEGREVR